MVLSLYLRSESSAYSERIEKILPKLDEMVDGDAREGARHLLPTQEQRACSKDLTGEVRDPPVLAPTSTHESASSTRDPMKIVVISDIHGNLDALAALQETCDEVWVLGDLVNSGRNRRR